MGDHDERDAKTPPTPDRRDERQGSDAGSPERNAKAGMDREVGDLEDPDAVEDEGALPGRMGGGLAGG